jgi:hypothetical protein
MAARPTSTLLQEQQASGRSGFRLEVLCLTPACSLQAHCILPSPQFVDNKQPPLEPVAWWSAWTRLQSGRAALKDSLKDEVAKAQLDGLGQPKDRGAVRVILQLGSNLRPCAQRVAAKGQGHQRRAQDAATT